MLSPTLSLLIAFSAGATDASHQTKPTSVVLKSIAKVAGTVGGGTLPGALYRGLVIRQAEAAKLTQVRVTLNQLKTCTGIYYLDNGDYPSQKAGLSALIKIPGDLAKAGKADSWGGPYIDGGKLPKDPWGGAYRYQRKTVGKSIRITLSSAGADKRHNTADDIRLIYGN